MKSRALKCFQKNAATILEINHELAQYDKMTILESLTIRKTRAEELELLNARQIIKRGQVSLRGLRMLGSAVIKHMKECEEVCAMVEREMRLLDCELVGRGRGEDESGGESF